MKKRKFTIRRALSAKKPTQFLEPIPPTKLTNSMHCKHIVKLAAAMATKKNTDMATKKNIDMATKKNTDMATKKNTDMATEKNTDMAAKKNTGSDILF